MWILNIIKFVKMYSKNSRFSILKVLVYQYIPYENHPF